MKQYRERIITVAEPMSSTFFNKYYYCDGKLNIKAILEGTDKLEEDVWDKDGYIVLRRNPDKECIEVNWLRNKDFAYVYEEIHSNEITDNALRAFNPF